MLRREVGYLLRDPEPAIEGGAAGGGGTAVQDPPASRGEGGDGAVAGGGAGEGEAGGSGDGVAGGEGQGASGDWQTALEKYPGLDDGEEANGKPTGDESKPSTGDKPSTQMDKTGTPQKPKPGTQGPAPKPDAKTQIPQFKTNKELRSWAEGVAADSHKIKTEAETLRREVQTLRKNSQTGDVQALTRTNAELTLKVQEYENELRISRYESSAEYKDKFQAPIQSKTAKAFKLVQDLTVEIVDPSDPENKTSRQGTKADFQAIYAAPNRSAARKLAKQLFGDDADDVIRYRDEINDLVEQSDESREKYRTDGAKAEQQTQAQRAREAEARNAMWIEANTGYRKNPKIARHFNEDPDDPDFNQKLNSGYEFVDEFFGPNRSKYTVQQLIVADTKIRNRSAAYPAAMHRLAKAEAANVEKDKIIAQLRGSAPGGRNKSSGGGAGTVATAAGDGDQNYDNSGRLVPVENRIDQLPE